MDKKIAICFYGQTRTAEVLEKTYSNMPNIDFFVSTWDDFNNKQVFNFCKMKEFLNPNILDFANNTQRSSFLIHRVNHLKSRYEIINNFTYDLVMWTRSEILYNKIDLNDFFTNLNIEDKLYGYSNVEKDDQDNYYITADYSFFSPSHIFDIYATGFKNKNILNKSLLKAGGHNYHAYNIILNNLKLETIKLYHTFQFNKKTKRNIDE